MDYLDIITEGKLYKTARDIDKFYNRTIPKIEKMSRGWQKQCLKYFEQKYLKAGKGDYITDVRFRLKELE